MPEKGKRQQVYTYSWSSKQELVAEPFCSSVCHRGLISKLSVFLSEHLARGERLRALLRGFGFASRGQLLCPAVGGSAAFDDARGVLHLRWKPESWNTTFLRSQNTRKRKLAYITLNSYSNFLESAPTVDHYDPPKARLCPSAIYYVRVPY